MDLRLWGWSESYCCSSRQKIICTDWKTKISRNVEKLKTSLCDYPDLGQRRSIKTSKWCGYKSWYLLAGEGIPVHKRRSTRIETVFHNFRCFGQTALYAGRMCEIWLWEEALDLSAYRSQPLAPRLGWRRRIVHWKELSQEEEGDLLMSLCLLTLICIYIL